MCLRLQELREELLQRYSESEKAAAWARSAEIVKTYNDELVTRWKEEMDTLLVYVRKIPLNLSLSPARLIDDAYRRVSSQQF